MPDPLLPQATATAATRLSFDISDLRGIVEEIERTHTTTVVQTTDPSALNDMKAGSVWINQTTSRMFVSAGSGVWVSADAQRKFGEDLAQVCTTGTSAAGPALTVLVPPTGIVGLMTDAEIRGGTIGAGSFAATTLVTEATDFPGGVNMTTSSDATQFLRRLSVPANPNGTSYPYAGWIVYRATPGLRTYTLALNAAGGANVCFQNRRLWVATF